jgi:hypothetical protein
MIAKTISKDEAVQRISDLPYWEIKYEKGKVLIATKRNNPNGLGFPEAIDSYLEREYLKYVIVRLGLGETDAKQREPYLLKAAGWLEEVEAVELQPHSDRPEYVTLQGFGNTQRQQASSAASMEQIQAMIEAKLAEQNAINEQKRLEERFELSSRLLEKERENQENILKLKEQLLRKEIQFEKQRNEEFRRQMEEKAESTNEWKEIGKTVLSGLGDLAVNFLQKPSDAKKPMALAGVPADKPKPNISMPQFTIKNSNVQINAAEEKRQKLLKMLEEDESLIDDLLEYAEGEEEPEETKAIEANSIVLAGHEKSQGND